MKASFTTEPTFASSPSSLASSSAPPRSRGLPLVGSLPSLLRDPLHFLRSAQATYGDVYTLDLGTTEAVLLNHPRHAQHVLRDRADRYGKGGPLWSAVRSLLGNGLPVSEGDFWRRQRRLMQPQFHRERIAAMAGLMSDAIDDGLADCDAAAATSAPVDVARVLSQTTMKVIVKTMFGAGLTRHEADTVFEHMNYLVVAMMGRMLTDTLPSWLPMPGRRRYDASVAAVDAIVFDVIRRGGHGSEVSGSLIDMLLDMVDAETGARMTPKELRDEAVSIFVAGYETTAASMAFALGFLAEHPQVARSLEDEVDGVLGDRRAGFADLRRLPRTLAVVQEAMRLAPPAYWLPRVALEDDVIDGYAIRAGSVVAPVIYTIHRNPRVWSDPERFDPDRFSPAQSAGRHGLAFMPFGAGQRQCIGKEFAMMEAQLILARIVQRYRLSSVPGKPIEPQLGATLRPKSGVWLRMERRAPGAEAVLPRAA